LTPQSVCDSLETAHKDYVVKIYPVLCPLKEDQEYQDFEMDDQLPALVAVPDVLITAF